MRDVMVLAKDAAQVAATEEDAARAIVACDAGFFAKVGADDVHFHCGGADEAVARLLVTIDPAEARAEVAVAEVGVGKRAFPGGINGGDEVVAGDVVVQEERWGEMEGTLGLEYTVLNGGWRMYGWAEYRWQTRCHAASGCQHHHAVLFP
jgi:hypothetical protein